MPETVPSIVVEFYGVPRQRAGRTTLNLFASTARQALQRVETECPSLAGLLQDGRLGANYLVSLNGERFLAHLDEPLNAGVHLLILGADAGG